jgi:hypothetical protein
MKTNIYCPTCHKKMAIEFSLLMGERSESYFCLEHGSFELVHHDYLKHLEKLKLENLKTFEAGLLRNKEPLKGGER